MTDAGPATRDDRWRWWPDVPIAVAATAFMAVGTSHIPRSGSERALDLLGYALIVVAGLALGLARRNPVPVLAVVTAALAGYILRRYVGGPIYVTGWLALAVVSWKTDRRTAVLSGLAAWIVLGSASLAAAGDRWVGALVFVGWSAAAVLLGEVLHNRTVQRQQQQQRARDRERSREEETRRRIAEERLRIARDLHDGVAHAMAIINVQAGAAAHVVDRRPEAARDALSAIQHASADVLDELGALLGLLRAGDAEVGSRAPAPGIGDIPRLVGTAGDALEASVRIDGPVERVPHPVSVAAYRVVQESLTNVLRHSRAHRVEVGVHTTDGHDLAVEVRDDGVGPQGAPSGGTGMGIRGMRERVESTRGRFDATPGERGGFVVTAVWSGE